MLQALENLSPSWEQIKGKGIIRVSKGSKKYTQLMIMPKIRRMLSNKIVRFQQAKNLEYMLNSEKDTNIPKKLDK